MKRVGKLLILAFMALCLGVMACGKKEESGFQTNKNSVDNVLKARVAKENGETTTQAAETTNSSETIGSTTPGVDLDLTTMTPGYAYAQIYNILGEPEKYLDQVIKLDGSFTYYQDEKTGIYYYACLLMDSTACCSYPFQFTPVESVGYPQRMPEVGTPITVVGTFEFCKAENGSTYANLKEAKATLK